MRDDAHEDVMFQEDSDDPFLIAHSDHTGIRFDHPAHCLTDTVCCFGNDKRMLNTRVRIRMKRKDRLKLKPVTHTCLDRCR